MLIRRQDGKAGEKLAIYARDPSNPVEQTVTLIWYRQKTGFSFPLRLHVSTSVQTNPLFDRTQLTENKFES